MLFSNFFKDDEGKKTGLNRLWEIIMDNTAHFFVCNILCLISLIPAILGVLYALSINNVIVLLASTVIGSMIFAPFYSAMINGMLIAMRDESGNWFKKYIHALKRDFKDSLIPAIFFGCLAWVIIYVLCFMKLGKSLPVSMILCTCISIFIFMCIFTYLWPQRVFFDLKLVHIVKNCVFMSLAHPLITILAVFAQIVYYSIIIFMLPYTIIFFVIFGVWFPSLLSMFITYKHMNKEFHIEEKLEEKMSNCD